MRKSCLPHLSNLFEYLDCLEQMSCAMLCVFHFTRSYMHQQLELWPIRKEIWQIILFARESNLSTPSLCIRWNESDVVLFAGTCTCSSSINVIIWWRRRYPYSHDDGWWYLISILFVFVTVNNLFHNFCRWKFKIFNYLSTNKRWGAQRQSCFDSYWYTLWPKSLSHFELICLWNLSMHSKWEWH